MGAKYSGIVALLLEKGADPNGADAGSYFNPLASAARSNDVKFLRLMLAYGGDASRVDDHGENVLHLALRFTNAECCRELLAHGADPCGRSKTDGETPMHVAARHAFLRDGPERVKILDLLLGAGASLRAVDSRGRTPGQLACQNEGTSKEVLEWFSQHDHV
jgi:ankyrin repeat protein